MSLYKTIREETKSILVSDRRSLSSVMLSLSAELGEIADEVAALEENNYKQPDEGVVVEAIDLIIGLVYLINRVEPNIKEKHLKEIAVRKIEEWKRKEAEHAKKHHLIASTVDESFHADVSDLINQHFPDLDEPVCLHGGKISFVSPSIRDHYDVYRCMECGALFDKKAENY